MVENRGSLFYCDLLVSIFYFLFINILVLDVFLYILLGYFLLETHQLFVCLFDMMQEACSFLFCIFE